MVTCTWIEKLTSYVTCRLDRQKNRKIFDWKKHHQYYIEQWELLQDNVDENNEPYMNREFRRYQAWYQGATHCRLRLQWTEDDYADIESSDNEDTAYDQTTRVGAGGGRTNLG